jgi:hypothetical protein
MADNSSGRLQKYLSGLAEEDLAQSDVTPGDPQLAALGQFLESNFTLPPNRVIVDFGSGKGLLAKMLALIWADRPTPHYFAVDLPEPLDALSIPRRLHNNSTKATVDEFYDDYLDRKSADISIVIVRNVLHELDLVATGALFMNLCSKLKPETTVYIQDMVNLPRLERGRAGWLADSLAGALREIGQEVSYLPQTSYSGTEWFSLTLRTKPVTDNEAVLRAFVSARSNQKKKLTETLASVIELKTTDAARITQLNNDIASIELQIFRLSGSSEQANAVRSELDVPLIPRATFGPYDAADGIEGAAQVNSGLVGVLSNKRLLDFPELLSGARQRVAMLGYSVRSLFENAASSDALKTAIMSGAVARLLIASPTSPAVKLRSTDPVYVRGDELALDIENTLTGVRLFGQHLREADAGKAAGFAVRVFDSLPHASYLIVDDRCFVSLYSRRLSGSSGFCLIFQKVKTAPAGYFDALLQDFEDTWVTAEVFL